MGYVDEYVLPVPKKHLAAYRRLAQKAHETPHYRRYHRRR